MVYVSRAALESIESTAPVAPPPIASPLATKPAVAKPVFQTPVAKSPVAKPPVAQLPTAPPRALGNETITVARASRETVNNSPWELSLPEAQEIAFQHSDVVRTLQSGGVQIGPATRYDPAITNELTNRALAAFDVSLGSNFYWNRYLQPPDSFFGPGIPQQNRRDASTLSWGLTKRWSSGAETRVSYLPTPGYLFFPDGNGGGFNPNHSANMEFSIRQPLLKGAGRDVNRAPITIAQIKTDQSGWEFKGAMLEFARSVEQAYWDLLAARAAREAVSKQLPLLDEVVRIGEANLREGRAVASDVAKTRAERHAFRQRFFEAQAAVRERELRLRNLMGLPPDDVRELVPVTPPTRAPLLLDPEASANVTLNHQPRLLRQRLGVRVREVELLVAKNGMWPQLDLLALYRANGLSDDLGRALEMMAGNEFHDWEFGAAYSVPLGRRDAKAAARGAELQLARERAVLREMTHVTFYQVEEQIVQIRALAAQLDEAEARVHDAQEWLRGARVRYESPPPAGGGQNWLLLALDDYLRSLRSATEADAEVGRLLARYNTELARLWELEGTLLEKANIHVLNDPCVAVASVTRSELRVRNEDFGAAVEDSLDYRSGPAPHAVSAQPVHTQPAKVRYVPGFEPPRFDQQMIQQPPAAPDDMRYPLGVAPTHNPAPTYSVVRPNIRQPPPARVPPANNRPIDDMRYPL